MADYVARLSRPPGCALLLYLMAGRDVTRHHSSSRHLVLENATHMKKHNTVIVIKKKRKWSLKKYIFITKLDISFRFSVLFLLAFIRFIVWSFCSRVPFASRSHRNLWRIVSINCKLPWSRKIQLFCLQVVDSSNKAHLMKWFIHVRKKTCFQQTSLMTLYWFAGWTGRLVG